MVEAREKEMNWTRGVMMGQHQGKGMWGKKWDCERHVEARGEPASDIGLLGSRRREKGGVERERGEVNYESWGSVALDDISEGWDMSRREKRGDERRRDGK